MEFNAKAEIARELEPNEQVLWSGVPYAGAAVCLTDAVPLIGGGVFVIGMLSGALHAIFVQGEYTGILLAVVASGLATFVFGWPMVFNPRRRAQTCYALTEKRAIIVYQGWRREVRSISLDSVTQMGFIHHTGGYGSIVFDMKRHPFDLYRFKSGFHAPIDAEFERIPDALSVSELLYDVRKKSGATLEPVRHGV